MAKLIIVDYETTGLNPEEGCPIELAMVAVDTTRGKFCEIDSFSSIILPGLKGWRDTMNERVLRMHTDNGLLDEIESCLYDPDKVVCRSFGSVYERALKFVEAHTESRRMGPTLGGFNPDFDRGWMKVWMPELQRAFSYRSCDANALWQMKNWTVGRGRFSKKTAHRALQDCRDTLAVYDEFARIIGLGFDNSQGQEA